MAIIKQSNQVPYSAAQMYTLVDQVEDYPDFLPWCARSEVHSRDKDEVRATLSINAMGFEKSFTTLNRLQQDKMIEIRLIDGPFKHLEGFWQFEACEGGCIVSVDLEFEFGGGVLNFAMEPIFHQAASTMVDAFTAQAEQVYDSTTVSS